MHWFYHIETATPAFNYCTTAYTMRDQFSAADKTYSVNDSVRLMKIIADEMKNRMKLMRFKR